MTFRMVVSCVNSAELVSKYSTIDFFFDKTILCLTRVALDD
jgi:hypothetical protein